MHPALARALTARGYAEPTAVQLAVLEFDAANRDLLVSAQTGSGKTVAFGLALGARLLGESERVEPATSPLALIIAPTRELAMQVCRELTWLYEDTGARVVSCVGGMDARMEGRQLDRGAHIVVGTPGRLRDHLERRRLDLSKLRSIVLDEADEMLDLGFREDLEFILDKTPADRQTLLFSATLPREIEDLARRYQRDAQRIATVRRDEQHADIDYQAHRVAGHDIENAVVNVLRIHEARAALVFCATREAVKRLSARLLERGFSAVALSGELTQHERTTALQALRDGRARVLVATDVAARGLDLPDLALVIHADLPNDGETLLHRSGRTGRAGKKGLTVLIVPYSKRRKADGLIASARLKVTWAPAPTPEAIRARDQERFVADPNFTAPANEDELQLAKALQAARTADEIALALVRMHKAQLPAPEDLVVDAGPPRLREGRPGEDRFRGKDRERFERRGHDRGGEDRGASGDRPFRPRRDDKREMVWFRINIGRDRNADPRWLLPLICRTGEVTKPEIGLIKIGEKETRFQIVAEHADNFHHAVRTSKNKEGHIDRVQGANPEDIATVAAAIDALPAPATTPQGERPERPHKKDYKSYKERGDKSDRPAREPYKARFKDHGDGAERPAANEPEKVPQADQSGADARSDSKPPFKAPYKQRFERQDRGPQREPYKARVKDQSERTGPASADDHAKTPQVDQTGTATGTDAKPPFKAPYKQRFERQDRGPQREPYKSRHKDHGDRPERPAREGGRDQQRSSDHPGKQHFKPSFKPRSDRERSPSREPYKGRPKEFGDRSERPASREHGDSRRTGAPDAGAAKEPHKTPERVKERWRDRGKPGGQSGWAPRRGGDSKPGGGNRHHAGPSSDGGPRGPAKYGKKKKPHAATGS